MGLATGDEATVRDGTTLIPRWVYLSGVFTAVLSLFLSPQLGCEPVCLVLLIITEGMDSFRSQDFFYTAC